MSPSGGLKHFHLQRKQLIKTVQGPLKGERQMMQAGDEGGLGLCWLSLFSRTFELFILVFLCHKPLLSFEYVKFSFMVVRPLLLSFSFM